MSQELGNTRRGREMKERDYFELAVNPTAQILRLWNRVADLEEKVFPEGKERTAAQQMLLLKHSGLLYIFLKCNLKVKDTAQFLHLLLNKNADNIEGHLSEIIKRQVEA
jgi:hypothetical protein